MEEIFLNIFLIISLVTINAVFIKKYLPIVKSNFSLIFKGERSIGTVSDYKSRMSVGGSEEFCAEIIYFDRMNNERKFFTDYDFTRKPLKGSKAVVVYSRSDSSKVIFLKRGLGFFTALIVLFFLCLNVIILNYYFRWV